ncbi:MAG: stage III sporulation protein AA [Defluviitaleaceae bacterium]|nr:stage III sporulation protein AA [Defluviitaleaceae bacterium]
MDTKGSIKEQIRVFLGIEPARRLMTLCPGDFEQITELRLRADKPMFVRLGGQDYVLIGQGKSEIVSRQAYHPTATDIAETIERISQYSFYAFESELSHGYITLPGGHRVGVAGQTVVDNGVVQAWRHISSINFRIAHSVIGCGDSVLPYLYEGTNAMIISPPGAGKTTLLRDIIRQLSNGGLNIGLVDERSEVAGCFQGIPQNDVGLRTDVLDGCPKATGMRMLLRSMAPDAIAVDELGGAEDARAVEAVLTAGVRLLCTAHGNNLDDIKKNPTLSGLVDRRVFDRYIILNSPGYKPQILDREGRLL